MLTIALTLPLTIGVSGPAMAQAPNSELIEELTWTELRDAIKSGKDTVIIPVGGVEQSGPLVALGKHDVRAKVLCERIARELGNALVAPVVAYVPEGGTDPPTGHMRFPGTITIPAAVFRATLESAAVSFKLHGFKTVVLLGDHGGYQSDLKAVADALNRRWAKTGARAVYVPDYYRATQTLYVNALRQRGYSPAEIGTHAGLADTSLMLAVDASLVRRDRLGSSARLGAKDGVRGNPTRATAALGALGVQAVVRETTQAIKAAQHQH